MTQLPAPHVYRWLSLGLFCVAALIANAEDRVAVEPEGLMEPAADRGALQRLDTSRHAEVTSGVGLEENGESILSRDDPRVDRVNHIYMITFEGMPEVPEQHPLAEAHYGTEHRITGEILETRSVRLPLADGEPERFLLAHVRLAPGVTCVASLGEESELEDSRFKPRDSIEMTAATGRLSGARILIARNLKTDQGRGIEVNQNVVRASFPQHQALIDEAQ